MIEQKKNPVGRPRTTVNDLPADWKQIMINCGTEGGSAVEVRCLLGISQAAFETLIEDSEEFSLTEKIRQELCEVWWHRQGRRMTTDGQGSSAVWIFNMKNRFGWRDKHDIEHSGGISVVVAPDEQDL